MTRISLLTISFLSTFLSINLSAQIMSTYAGDTSHGYSGDGGQAIHAHLNSPTGLAADKKGNLFIADMGNNCVRKINAEGIISTFAGTGVEGYTGDSVAATATQLDMPISLTVDGPGNVYIAESGNCRIRMVDTNNMISTIYNGLDPASSPTLGTCPMAIAVNKNGVVYFSSNYEIYWLYYGYAMQAPTGSASDVALMTPSGLMFDTSGNLFIANSTGDVGSLLKMDTGGYIISLAGGNACGSDCASGGAAVAASIYSLTGVIQDTIGNSYVLESPNNRVLKITPAGMLSVYAGICGYGSMDDSCNATDAQLGCDEIYGYNPIAIDTGGNIYVAEYYLNRVRKISPTGHMETITYANTPIAKNGSLDIYPNPNNGLCHVIISSPTQELVKATITNVVGEKMETFDMNTNTEITKHFDLAPGVYFINAKTHDATYNTKFIIR